MQRAAGAHLQTDFQPWSIGAERLDVAAPALGDVNGFAVRVPEGEVGRLLRRCLKFGRQLSLGAPMLT